MQTVAPIAKSDKLKVGYEVINGLLEQLEVESKDSTDFVCSISWNIL